MEQLVENKTRKAAIGRFVSYVTDGKVYASLKEPFDPLTITFEQAEELIAQKEIAARPLAELGEDPTSKGAIVVRTGRYGAYVTDGKTNASLGKLIDPLTLTHEEAVEILIKKRAAPVKKFGRRAPKKTQTE